MNFAIIPARGGSKRIKRKNVADFCGKPMLAWSIEAAKQSGCFEQIIVSTDDEQIAEVAENYGACVPFKRPTKLADDYATTAAVMQHASSWVKKSFPDIENLCCVYATAPLLSPAVILEGLDAMKSQPCDFAISVTTFAFPIQRALRISMNDEMSFFDEKFRSTRSQDLDEAWHDAGQFYWGRIDAWIKQLPIISDRTKPIKISRHLVQDIDTPEDWARAEWLFKSINACEL
jgi:N-acylneuraminate cytidylyltransferase